MNASNSDQPAPNPDQESIDAWRASVEAADHAEIRARDAEEAFAKTHSRPTRILGWLVIGGIIIQFVGSFSRQDLDLGGIIFLIAGVRILQGSQAWVRFVALVGPFILLVFLARLIWPLIIVQPVMLRREWYSYGDLRLWTSFICPTVFMTAESILAFVALQHRQLPFWTRTAKISVAVAAGICLLQALFAISRDLKNQKLCRQFPMEIQKAEDYIRTHGDASSPAADQASQELISLPALHSVSVSISPGGGKQLAGRNSSEPPGSIHKATRYVKLPSGEWGKLELELILPDTP